MAGRSQRESRPPLNVLEGQYDEILALLRNHLGIEIPVETAALVDHVQSFSDCYKKYDDISQRYCRTLSGAARTTDAKQIRSVRTALFKLIREKQVQLNQLLEVKELDQLSEFGGTSTVRSTPMDLEEIEHSAYVEAQSSPDSASDRIGRISDRLSEANTNKTRSTSSQSERVIDISRLFSTPGPNTRTTSAEHIMSGSSNQIESAERIMSGLVIQTTLGESHTRRSLTQSRGASCPPTKPASPGVANVKRIVTRISHTLSSTAPSVSTTSTLARPPIGGILNKETVKEISKEKTQSFLERIGFNFDDRDRFSTPPLQIIPGTLSQSTIQKDWNKGLISFGDPSYKNASDALLLQPYQDMVKPKLPPSESGLRYQGNRTEHSASSIHPTHLSSDLPIPPSCSNPPRDSEFTYNGFPEDSNAITRNSVYTEPRKRETISTGFRPIDPAHTTSHRSSPRSGLKHYDLLMDSDAALRRSGYSGPETTIPEMLTPKPIVPPVRTTPYYPPPGSGLRRYDVLDDSDAILRKSEYSEPGTTRSTGLAPRPSASLVHNTLQPPPPNSSLNHCGLYKDSDVILGKSEYSVPGTTRSTGLTPKPIVSLAHTTSQHIPPSSGDDYYDFLKDGGAIPKRSVCFEPRTTKSTELTPRPFADQSAYQTKHPEAKTYEGFSNYPSFDPLSEFPTPSGEVPTETLYQPRTLSSRVTAPSFMSTFLQRGHVTSSESYHPSIDLQTFSNHLLESSLSSRNIDKYDGKAHRFWPWVGQVRSKMNILRLNPDQILNVLENHCTGEPLEFIKKKRYILGDETFENIEKIWKMLISRFGHEAKISDELMTLVKDFPAIKGKNVADQLDELLDLCRMVLCNLDKCPDLVAQMDTVTGIRLIRGKLPINIQNAWAVVGRRFHELNHHHANFEFFIDFLSDQLKKISDPSYEIIYAPTSTPTKSAVRILSTEIHPKKEVEATPLEQDQNYYQEKSKPSENVKDHYHQDSKIPEKATNQNRNQNSDRGLSKREITYKPPTREEKFCLFCEKKGHKIHNCFEFRAVSHEQQQQVIMKHDLCFRCLGRHRVATCQVDVVCFKCNGKHATAFHLSRHQPRSKADSKPSSVPPKEGRTDDLSNQDKEPQVLCTRIEDTIENVNCSKTLLVEISMAEVPDKTITAYAIIDEQSNRTLVDDRVLKFFGKEFPTTEYCMKVAVQDCEFNKSGKLVSGLSVRGKFEDEIIPLPEALSCQDIADTTSGVASPRLVRTNEAISKYAHRFPEVEPQTPVLLLIGRDCGRAMATECLTTTEPYVHRTPLGFSLVGNIKPQNQLEKQVYPRVLLTSVQKDHPVEVRYNFSQKRAENFETFATHPDDDQPGLSYDDKEFMAIIQPNIKINQDKKIEIPLPLRDKKLPDNEGPVYFRTKKTTTRLQSDPEKLEECLQSMQKSIDNHYIEKIPPGEVETPDNPTWYLPIFCVEQKKKKLRLVYDASAKYGGTSLNDALYQGPDLNNQLRNVLLRFRERPIAFAADIQAMFNNFSVPQDQKDLMRFFWFDGNDPSQELVPYRSTCHIFGCISSPAVCAFGLKYCANHLPAEDEAREYLDKNFYVDDGLYSTDSTSSAIEILSQTSTLLKSFGMNLHKIVSNSPAVLEHFPDALRSVPLATLPSENENCSALGVKWNTETDKFIMIPDLPSRPFTKRGILSVINSLFDPVGLVSPVILQGRLMQRQILSNKSDLKKYDWDDELPHPFFKEWSSWLSSLEKLTELNTPRGFFPQGFSPIRQELHIFSDASEKALGYVAYLRSLNKECEPHVAFVMASSKLAPRTSTTMPRMELNAAVEACKNGFKITAELRHKPDEIYFHTDSQIVLGYLANKRRRFSNYVERRINTINSLFPDSNWSYISTKENPADQASRPCSPNDILTGSWLEGPSFLWNSEYTPENSFSTFDPSTSLPEEKLEVNAQSTQISQPSAFLHLFSRTNSLFKISRIFKIVLKFVRSFDKIRQKRNPDFDLRPTEVSDDETRLALIRIAQNDCFSGELTSLKSGIPLADSNKLSKLSPTIDSTGLMRVGGRLKHSDIVFSVKHPILIPEKHPIASILIQHFHKLNKHQGSLITHNSIIQHGIHIQNGRRLIRDFLNSCIICKKLRARTSVQKMADLPPDRLANIPPFSHVGIDVFGPFYIHDGRSTRHSKGTKKIWALIIVCLPSRAVHLEYLPGMDTSSFRNAFQRFQAIRGPCKTVRSDQGSNFILAKKQMEALDISSISEDLQAQGVQWTFNSPHASHQGGSWERKIGSVRRVLEATFELISHRGISRDEFITFIAEAASVVNNTPLWVPSYDPNDPTPITPQMILTLRKHDEAIVLDDFTEEDILAYGHRRYRRCQYLASRFWHRWRTEYLHTLTARQKWRKPSPCLAVGDVVLIKEKNLARNAWPLGRISATKPSSDGLVRKVILTLPPLPGRTSTRSVERAVTDLVLLLPNSAQSASDSVQGN